MRFLFVRVALVAALCLPSTGIPAWAQSSARTGDQLQFVVYLSRHGVRSPTGSLDQYYSYSRARWPLWDVPPGYLTAHGFEDMRLLGAYDRMLLAREGLLKAAGCDDAARVSFYADSDQRTRESGKALAEGMFPACSVLPGALPEGTPDPLFHPLRVAQPNPEPVSSDDDFNAQATRLTQALRPQLTELDHILATCGTPASPDHNRISILDIPTVAEPGKGRDGRPGELRGPLGIASTLTENFLLEFTEGMPMQDVAWGCADGASLRRLIGLHTAASNARRRDRSVARMQAVNLLDRIGTTMEHAVANGRDAHAPSSRGDRALFLIGHDTNLNNVAGVLHLSWFADGRRDDTPPGSALVVELWRSRSTGSYFVRLWYIAQTLDQMRNAVTLNVRQPPQRIPLRLSGCAAVDGSGCTWNSFEELLARASHPSGAIQRGTKKQRRGE
jgi:4-phytase/acid phosphatase